MAKEREKVTPQQSKETLILPSRAPIRVGSNAVESNNSKKSSEEFVKALQKGAKENIFTPKPSGGDGE